jgi:hypothetical protein
LQRERPDWHGLCEDQGTGDFLAGAKTMQKFEMLAFSAGFILTGFLTLVALPLA